MNFLMRILFVYGLLLFLTSINLNAQSKEDRFRLMFYNTENLFDIFDDTTKWDEQFLPEGDKRWTPKKYKDKLLKISKVILAVGEWRAPDIVGLCEVENRLVLEDLVKKTPLSELNYKIIHQESPDRRGIDVAMLYNPERFKVLSTSFIPINFSKEYARSKTRDLLVVNGVTSTKDTITVFINHWPSRYGGQFESEPKRLFLAKTVRGIVDSLFNINPRSNIIIMGDLNDTPQNKSVKTVLRAQISINEVLDTCLYDLTANPDSEIEGTHKYQGEWGVLDHVIVSGNLLKNKVDLSGKLVYKKDFLLEPDDKYIGEKVFRTYIGFKYNGGFSDHLPIYLDLLPKSNN